MVMPRQSESEPSSFDKFADTVDRITSKSAFFAFCVASLVLWGPLKIILPLDTWQLIVNTYTTIITFLLVAVGANTSRRAWSALQSKLNAIAKFLHDLGEAVMWLMEQQQASTESHKMVDDLHGDIDELAAAIGLEDREGS